MAKKHKLSIGLEPDFTILGLSTTLKDYTLAYHINKELNIRLSRIPDFHYKVVNMKGPASYSIYIYNKPNDLFERFLLSNKSSEGRTLTKLKQVDYYFLIQGDIHKKLLEWTMQKLKTIQHVLAVFHLQTSGDPMFRSILNDLELHILQKDNPSV